MSENKHEEKKFPHTLPNLYISKQTKKIDIYISCVCERERGRKRVIQKEREKERE